jgi:hypothetical protein
MQHEVLILGQLNDGIEAAYPGTDVRRLASYVQGLLGVEMDRRLGDVLPRWWSEQGTPGADSAGVGVAVAPDSALQVTDHQWVELVSPSDTGRYTERQALVVRADFYGCPLTLLSAHRPVQMRVDTRPEFDANLTALIAGERAAGRVTIAGVDLNTARADAAAVAARCGMLWVPPYLGSIVGFLIGRGVSVIGVAALRKDGEHPPVVAMLRVPLLNAPV